MAKRIKQILTDPLGKMAMQIAAIIVMLQNRMTSDALEIGRLLGMVKKDLGDAKFNDFVTKTLKNGWKVGQAEHFIEKSEQFADWSLAEWNKLGSAVKRTLFQVGISNEAAEALRMKAHSLLGTTRMILRPTYDDIVKQFQSISSVKRFRLWRDDGTMKALKTRVLKGGLRRFTDVTDNGIGGRVVETRTYDRKGTLVRYTIQAIVNKKIVAEHIGENGQISIAARSYCLRCI